MQNCALTMLQVGKVGGSETPFDFGIAGKRAGAGAGDVGEDALEGCGGR
jgi:hypothetical protein